MTLRLPLTSMPFPHHRLTLVRAAATASVALLMLARPAAAQKADTISVLSAHPASSDTNVLGDAKHVRHRDRPGVQYRSGRGLYLNADSASLRVRAAVQPMLRFATNSNLPDAQAQWILRRARFDLEARLPDALTLRFAIQAKNMHLGLSNLYGAWAPNEATELAVGYLKPPGGLERDAASFDEPFIERSVVAFLTYDKEVGARVRHTLGDGRSEVAFAVTRPAAFGTDGGDPEDAPSTTGTGLPAGVDPEDLLNGAGNFDFNGRYVFAPSDRFATGISAGARLRPDGALGDRLAEPYDTQIYGAVPYKGLSSHVAADAAVASTHLRVLAEGGYRRDGAALDSLASGHTATSLGYVTFGFTPGGHYEAARDGAVLREGWEIITRVEGAHLVPPSGLGSATTWWSATSGVHWEATRALRLQADVAYEHFDRYATGTNNAGAHRMFFQLWSTFRL
jgi:hypothetical protein